MKTIHSKLAFTAVITGLMPVGLTFAQAQIQNASGQNVVPVYEGWERNKDGSFNMASPKKASATTPDST